MKTYAILTTLAFISCLIIIFWPSSPSKEDQTLLNQRDSILLSNKKLQAQYDLIAIVNDKLQARLVIAESNVKRSEEKLSKSLANEKVLLRTVKEQSLKMTDVQADSAIRERFKDDPDSVEQKVFVSLTKLDESDSVRKRLEDFTNKLRISGMLTDSVVVAQGKLLYTSQIQIRTLEKIPEIDYKIIDSKDKQIKKLKRRNKILKIAIPVAVVLTVVLL